QELKQELKQEKVSDLPPEKKMLTARRESETESDSETETEGVKQCEYVYTRTYQKFNKGDRCKKMVKNGEKYCYDCRKRDKQNMKEVEKKAIFIQLENGYWLEVLSQLVYEEVEGERVVIGKREDNVIQSLDEKTKEYCKLYGIVYDDYFKIDEALTKND